MRGGTSACVLESSKVNRQLERAKKEINYHYFNEKPGIFWPYKQNKHLNPSLIETSFTPSTMWMKLDMGEIGLGDFWRVPVYVNIVSHLTMEIGGLLLCMIFIRKEQTSIILSPTCQFLQDI